MNVESFEVDCWDELQTGIILSENDEWLLVYHIRADYALDGYKLYNKHFIANRINSSRERLIERVLTLRKINIELPKDFQFLDTIETLKWSQDKFGLFEFQDDHENELFYGRIKNVMDNNLTIDFIDSKGIVDDDFDVVFDIQEITSISFQSDYFHSIQALWMDENNIIPTP